MALPHSVVGWSSCSVRLWYFLIILTYVLTQIRTDRNDTPVVFPKYILKKSYFEKKSADDNKPIKNNPACQERNGLQSHVLRLVQIVHLGQISYEDISNSTLRKTPGLFIFDLCFIASINQSAHFIYPKGALTQILH